MAPHTPGEAPDVETLADQPRLSLDYGDVTQEELVGTGGNAEVYRATVPGHEGPVALKVPRIQGTLSATAVEQFVAEAETWAKLDDHPHVVSLLDWGERPMPWLVMEHMDAGHLGERVGAVGPREAVWICSRVARALRHAHTRGVAHLDLKPANVLFATAPGDAWDVPKVSDWGLAKLLLEHSQSVEGLSPQYAAPEQFDAEEFGHPDIHTDVFQLGVVAYELLTGTQPFEGSHAAVMRAVMEDDPAPPSEVADVPPAVDDVVLRALEKRKADRYEDVLLFRDELDDLLADLAEPDDGAATSTAATDEPGASEESGLADGDEEPSGAGATTAAAQSDDGPTASAAGETASSATAEPTDEERQAALSESTLPESLADDRGETGSEASAGDEHPDASAEGEPSEGERYDAATDGPGAALAAAVTRNGATMALAVAVVLTVARGDVVLAPTSRSLMFYPSIAVPAVAGLLFGLPGVAGVILGAVGAELVWWGSLGFLSPYLVVGQTIEALVPYVLWRRTDVLSGGVDPDFRSRRGRQALTFLLVVAVGAAISAAVTATGFLLGPPQVDAVDVFVTPLGRILLATLVLGPPLLYLLYPRLRRARERHAG